MVPSGKSTPSLNLILCELLSLEALISKFPVFSLVVGLSCAGSHVQTGCCKPMSFSPYRNSPTLYPIQGIYQMPPRSSDTQADGLIPKLCGWSLVQKGSIISRQHLITEVVFLLWDCMRLGYQTDMLILDDSQNWHAENSRLWVTSVCWWSLGLSHSSLGISSCLPLFWPWCCLWSTAPKEKGCGSRCLSPCASPGIGTNGSHSTISDSSPGITLMICSEIFLKNVDLQHK